MATSQIAVSEGSGKNIASHSISEDGKTKELQRMVPSTSSGVEISPSVESGGNLDTIAGDTTSIDGKTPVLGQALAADSVPVVLTAAQQTALTPPAAITGFATEAKQLPDGHSVALSATDNAVLDSIEANTGNVDDKLGEVQATPTANTLLGRLKDLLTGIVLSAGSAIIGKVGIDQTTPGTTNKVSLGTDSISVVDSVTAKTGLHIKAAYTASQTASTILTPTSGKKIVITSITISASAAGTVYLMDNTDSATTCIGPTLSLAANGGWEKDFGAKTYALAAANNVVKYTSGAGAAGSISISYYEE